MEKVLKYQKLVMSLLDSYAREWSEGTTSLTFETVFDKEQHHYQILSHGWLNDRHIHFSPVHIDIIGGKVWLQKNTTEEFVADTLVKQGVPKSDIVLGVLPPDYRKFSEFAAA